ncbi:hypothetical protein BFP70_17135 [Thioclava sp. SK-1]|uniref:phosphatidylglycerol lysyltransferase domain-containing protein n=1 Tax=Thioclava sp. SK-1 TaxID=1889770 RepID=UPI0008260390|nr:phosphatidylglycerol lysyltransferase domain-containing protein [Thioclava sp. SK-1]OCX61164.1 hypothetical protein BFP70_17135 [Thioclava sp. SK-1]
MGDHKNNYRGPFGSATARTNRGARAAHRAREYAAQVQTPAVALAPLSHRRGSALDASLAPEPSAHEIAADTALSTSLPGWAKALRRQGLAIALLLGFAWLLRERIAALDVDAIFVAFQQVSALQWIGAALACWASFAALANYDALIHRAMGTNQQDAQAKRAGWVAIAISQTVGFGLVSGALVRWRMLPGFSLIEASKLTATVAATFLAGWAVLTASVLLLAPVQLPGLPVFAVQGLALVGLAAGGTLAMLALWKPGWQIGKWRLSLPTLPVMGKVLWLALLDTIFAAAALYILMPEGTVHPLVALYPAFLLALGAGFVSGTPGGIGPFEVTLLMLLPGAEQAPLLAAVLAWRVLYYGAPAALAMGVVALGAPERPILERSRLIPPATELTPRIAQLVGEARQAEVGLLRQGEHSILLEQDMCGGWMVGRTQQVLVGLRDPFGRFHADEMLRTLRRHAHEQGRLACLYKITGRTAATARTLGWQVAPVAVECWLRPAQFTLDTPTRSGLRRKLRKAKKQGLTTTHTNTDMPLPEMQAVAQDWANMRGGERGFSMGRFAHDYIEEHEVILAHIDGRLVGFASFHANRHEWALDLMRTAHDAPDGTVHALITAAIEAAAQDECPRLSLAALPPRAEDVNGPAARVWRRAEKEAGAAGLRQFKMGFDPQLSTLYIAAPTRSALALAAADIARTIRRPAPLTTMAGDQPASSST